MSLSELVFEDKRPYDDILDRVVKLSYEGRQFVVEWLRRYERMSDWESYLQFRDVDVTDIFAVLEVLDEFLPAAPKLGRGT